MSLQNYFCLCFGHFPKRWLLPLYGRSLPFQWNEGNDESFICRYPNSKIRVTKTHYSYGTKFCGLLILQGFPALFRTINGKIPRFCYDYLIAILFYYKNKQNLNGDSLLANLESYYVIFYQKKFHDYLVKTKLCFPWSSLLLKFKSFHKLKCFWRN